MGGKPYQLLKAPLGVDLNNRRDVCLDRRCLCLFCKAVAAGESHRDEDQSHVMCNFESIKPVASKLGSCLFSKNTVRSTNKPDVRITHTPHLNVHERLGVAPQGVLQHLREPAQRESDTTLQKDEVQDEDATRMADTHRVARSTRSCSKASAASEQPHTLQHNERSL